MRRSSAEGGGEVVVVEVENRSRVPVALALAVRPCTPEGLTVVERIDLSGSTVTVDGRPALVLPRAPAKVAGSSLRHGDCGRGGHGRRRRRPLAAAGARPRPGLAQAAFVFPLAHGATFRAVIPLDDDPAASTFPRRCCPRPTRWPAAGPRRPSGACAWWLPDERLGAAVEACRRHLLARPARDAAVLAALDAYGYHDESAAALAAWAAGQRSDGSFGGAEATASVLVALAAHVGPARDPELAGAVAETVAEAVQWIDRARRSTGDGLLPAEPPAGRRFATDLWAVAGLRAGAAVLDAAGHPGAGADARGFAAELWAAVEAAFDGARDRRGTAAMPDGPDRPAGPGAGATLAACRAARPARRRPPGRRHRRARCATAGPPATAARPCSTRPAAASARCRPWPWPGSSCATATAGPRGRLAWVLDAATPTWTWPTAIHPQLGGGCGGDGHDPAASAALLRCVRDLLVREDGDGLAVASLVPGGWYGQGWEIHGAPTAHGQRSPTRCAGTATGSRCCGRSSPTPGAGPCG